MSALNWWENIKYKFTNTGVGAVDALYGNIENVLLRVFAMNEEYYVMIMVFTYGTNERFIKEKLHTVGGYSITFKYPETVKNTTNTGMLWTNTIQGAKDLLHWRRHGPQGARKIFFLLFCWICRR